MLVDFLAADPTFDRPPHRWAIIAVSLWTIAPLCVVFGGRPGLIPAAVAACYGTHLLRKHQRWAVVTSS